MTLRSASARSSPAGLKHTTMAIEKEKEQKKATKQGSQTNPKQGNQKLGGQINQKQGNQMNQKQSPHTASEATSEQTEPQVKIQQRSKPSGSSRPLNQSKSNALPVLKQGNQTDQKQPLDPAASEATTEQIEPPKKIQQRARSSGLSRPNHSKSNSVLVPTASKGNNASQLDKKVSTHGSSEEVQQSCQVRPRRSPRNSPDSASGNEEFIIATPIGSMRQQIKAPVSRGGKELQSSPMKFRTEKPDEKLPESPKVMPGPQGKSMKNGSQQPTKMRAKK